ncbi:uncharacterized protein LOC124354417 isoform X2 [Homalodisca vitripennis]|uniref:uncharacterized protein LOC124354417 isoform X2 n=1 Tax=Homalodisca vitripennis TaxID=197043 RepID=UPI001EECE8EE|nr:uncharacterized protein LOC124354417 isoform X2 [Homalodisca vitripennis]
MQIDPISKLGRDLKFSISTRNRTRYFGPELNSYVIPERNSEVFVGRLPSKTFEDKIYPFFAKAGQIYRIKLLLKMDGGNKGYCFVKYTTEAEASNAVATLNGVEFPGAPHGLYITRSTDHRTLMVTGAEVSLEKVCQDIQMRVDGHFNATTVVGNSAVYLLEFQEHFQAILVIRMFGPRTASYWGPMAVLDWQPNEQVQQRELEKRMQSLSIFPAIDELNITIPDSMSMGAADSDSGLGSASSTGSLQLQTHSAPLRFEPLPGHTNNNFTIYEPTNGSLQLQTHSAPLSFEPLTGHTDNNFTIYEPTNGSLQLQTHSVPPGFEPLSGHPNNNLVTNKTTNDGIHIVCTKFSDCSWLCKSEITDGQCPMKKILETYPKIVKLNNNVVNACSTMEYKVLSACTGLYLAYYRGDSKQVAITDETAPKDTQCSIKSSRTNNTDTFKERDYDETAPKNTQCSMKSSRTNNTDTFKERDYEWLYKCGLEMDLNCGYVPITVFRNTCFQVYRQMVLSDNPEDRSNAAVIHTLLKKALISELELFQRNEEYIMKMATPPCVHVIDDCSFKLIIQKEYKKLSLLTDAANMKRANIIFKFWKKIMELTKRKPLYQR